MVHVHMHKVHVHSLIYDASVHAVYKWRKGVYAVEGESEERTVTHEERSVS